MDDWIPCHYCGLPADTLDHVVPRSLIADLAILGDATTTAYLHDRHRIRTVNACRECNTLLGSRYYPTLELRKTALKELLRKRYRRHLRVPDWTPNELAQLSYTLRIAVEAGVAMKRLVQARLAH